MIGTINRICAEKLSLIVFLAAQSVIDTKFQLIPRKHIFAPPDFSAVNISPDGRWMSWVAYTNNTPNVWVQRLPQGQPFQLTMESGRGVHAADWALDNRNMIYSEDQDGDENWRLYIIDVYSRKSHLLTDTNQVAAVILASSVKFPSKIIIGLNNRDSRYHDAYELNIATGEKRLIFQNDHYAGYLFDDDLKIRLLREETDDGSKVYYLYDNGLSFGYYPVYQKVDFDDTDLIKPLVFDRTNKILYWLNLEDPYDDLSSFYAVDFLHRNRTLIYKADDKEPITGISFHPLLMKPLSVTINYEKPKRIFLDEEFGNEIKHAKKILAARSQSEETYDFSIAATSLDFNYWVIIPLSDRLPAKFHLYDTIQKNLTLLFSAHKVLEDYVMAPMHVVEMPIRDELSQLCYLTLPIESDRFETGRPASPQPLILLVHGGPWARDTWGFDVLAQFFSNRGYATLQCNYRSSTGLGKRVLNAGNGEWGRKMQDDLTDAVKWAIKNEIALPDKIAIFGGSYGGYAVLVGLTTTPDLFACGVDIVGPSNLVTLLHAVPKYWKPVYNSLIRRIGASPDTLEGRSFLDSISPLYKARSIRKPLLIAQGLNDPRVHVNESVQIVEALKNAKIPFTYMMFPNEGHGFVRPENMMAFYAETEQFLYKCLGGRSEPVNNEFEESLVQIERY